MIVDWVQLQTPFPAVTTYFLYLKGIFYPMYAFKKIDLYLKKQWCFIKLFGCYANREIYFCLKK